MEYINDSNKEFLNNLILSKTNISEQLKLLRKYRDREDVQEYIKNIENGKYFNNFKYTKYLIDKYFYAKKDLVKPDKNGIESFGKLQLQPEKVLKKREVKVETDIKIGDNVIVNCFEGIVDESNIAIVEDVDLDCGILYLKQHIFGEDIVYMSDLEDVKKYLP